MTYKIAEFKVKKEKLAECEAAIREFVAAVHANEKGTFIYDAYRKADGVSFIHLMCFKDAEAEKEHRETEHVKKFVSILYPNCEIQPVFTDLVSLAE